MHWYTGFTELWVAAWNLYLDVLSFSHVLSGLVGQNSYSVLYSTKTIMYRSSQACTHQMATFHASMTAQMHWYWNLIWWDRAATTKRTNDQYCFSISNTVVFHFIPGNSNNKGLFQVPLMVKICNAWRSMRHFSWQADICSLAPLITSL